MAASGGTPNTIRSLLVVSMATLAISVAALGIIGRFTPVYRSFEITSRFHIYTHFADGLMRLYWFRSEEPIDVEDSNLAWQMQLRRRSDGTVCLRYNHARVGAIKPYAWVSLPSQPRTKGGTPTARMNGVRSWSMLPVGLLTIYPAIAIFTARIRRRKRRPGHCKECDYNLTGNESGICPECGTPVPELA